MFSTLSRTDTLLRSSAAHGRHNTTPCIPAACRTIISTAGIWKPLVASNWTLQCNATSGPHTQAFTDVIRNGLALPVVKLHEIVEDDTEKDKHQHHFKDEDPVSDKIAELVVSVRSILRSMDDGEITISPYDTAWAALVEDIGHDGARRMKPQFPSCLVWISDNQLHDGSWGDRVTFSIYDRILNTLACVIALRSWNVHSDKSDKGIRFIKQNIHKLENEEEEHMPIGLEVALPSLIERAKNLRIEIPDDAPGLRQIYAKRDLKLTRIPRAVMHHVPTTLLHSLEGMPGLIWEKILKLQSEDGSFLFSPSSTAFALQQTRDRKCLKYLNKIVRKFNGGVPNVYPVDLFERIWAVDRLQRLGISRYFKPEIDECIQYVNRYWTDKGIGWARNSGVQDIDDTAMAFRLLRLHGYQVSAGVFEHFEKDGEFFCFAGQSNQAVTGMYNLYRATGVMFPGEHTLAAAANFSAKFLHEKRAHHDLLDKWIITKDLPGEVGYALDVPWYASLPRVEARFYLEQYGGEDDVWIGKTLYRMPYVNNNNYLLLAKLDYNNCQAIHQKEWKNILKWYRNCNLGEFGPSEERLLVAYYISAACLFEPEKSEERLAWTKTAILVEAIVSHFDRRQLSIEQKRAFIEEFQRGNILNYPNGGARSKTSLSATLLITLNQLSLDILLDHGRDIHQQLNEAWLHWLKTWEEGGVKIRSGDAELILRTLTLIGRAAGELHPSHPEYQQLLEATTSVCQQIRLFQQAKEDGKINNMIGVDDSITTSEIKIGMQKLVELVFTRSRDDIHPQMKHKFLLIAQSFYYAAYCSPGTINFHIAKVLFERVM